MSALREGWLGAGGSGVPPWIEWPFQLITWMDILQFSVARFYAVARTCEKITRMLDKLSPAERKKPIGPEFKSSMLDWATKIKVECEAVNLSMSLKSVQTLLRLIEINSDWETIAKRFEEVNERITDEIQDNLFLFIPKTHVRFFEDAWPEIAAAFPSTEYDVKEAGKCLALNRSTACVFHAMRVLECGLCALAKQFSVQFDHQTWNGIIEPIEAAIRRIKDAKRKPENWKDDERFYSEAAAQFMHFKNAWRNYTAHGTFKYTEDEAEAIYRHVRDFMRHIAKRFKEEPEAQA